MQPNMVTGRYGAKRSCDDAGRAAAAMATPRGSGCFGQTSLRQRQRTVDSEDYDPAGSVAMDGRLILVFVALTIG